jgi:putative ABC transport system permease protein
MSPHELTGTVERGLIFRLAASDLCHEWMLSLCLVLALAAVIAPLLLLFGLKFGTIETLRLRLIQDPKNREMRPVTTVVRDRDWFRATAKRPEVGFIIPTTRQIAAGVVVKQVNGEKRVEADLIPSASGDSLLLENGAPIPKSGQVVLTGMTAQSLNVRTGDHVIVSASRNRGGDSERAVVDMVVAGTLSMRASGLKAIYAPLEFLEAVEAYKDGLAVPELGWDGSLPVARPEYDGAIIVTNEKLPAEKQLKLVINTGFSSIEEIAGERLSTLAGWSVGSGHVIYWLRTETTTAGDNSLSAVRDQLRGLDSEVFPWVRPLAVTLGDATKTETQVQALSVSAEKALQLGVSPSPPWGVDERDPFRILLPANSPSSGIVVLTTLHLGNRLEVPVKVATASSVPGFLALVPAPLAGVLRLAETRALDFDPKSGKILLRRRNYAGFRLYARTIDDVEPLRRLVADQGIELHTEAQRIAEVTNLDGHLTRVFELIAAVSVTGAVAALVASLYASIERKRRELGVLRLVGLSGSHLVRFPVYQSLLFVAASYGLASACALGISSAINQLFRDHLQVGESFCRLPVAYQFASLSGALVLAAISACLAAIHISRASTAAALRDEG